MNGDIHDDLRSQGFGHYCLLRTDTFSLTLDQWEDLGFLGQARSYAWLGKGDIVIEALTKELEQPEHNDTWINVWPEFDSLRDDPRFKDLLLRMDLEP